MKNMPLAKTTDKVVQKLERELLIYDLVTNRAYCLNYSLTMIYDACDGKTEFDEFKKRQNLSDDFIFLALDKLHEVDLIDAAYTSPFKGINRRRLIRKIGLATAVALPVISSLVAPKAAMAAISCGGANAPDFRTCTRGEVGCETGIAATCQSCSATATPGPIPGCAPPFPVLCTCD